MLCRAARSRAAGWGCSAESSRRAVGRWLSDWPARWVAPAGPAAGWSEGWIGAGPAAPAVAAAGPVGSPGWSSAPGHRRRQGRRSEEHTSELQSLMRISYAVFCLKKKKLKQQMLNTKNKVGLN